MSNVINEKMKDIINRDETIEEKYNRKNNIFDYIRIILAFCVIFTHSYPIFFGPTASDPITEKILRTETVGGIAVICFLVLSGFMSTQSIIHSKNSKQFILKRILRIFPSLILMLLLTIFIIAPLGYSGEGPYFSKSVSDYFFGNVNVFTNTRYSIDGVFQNNPYPSAINGSIWTIKHEFMAYIVLMLLSLCSMLKDRKYTLGMTILVMVIYILGVTPVLTIKKLAFIGILNEISQFIKLLMYFLIGTTIYLYKDKIHVSFKGFIMACIILIFGILINITNYVIIFVLPYMLMYLGTIKISEKKDILKKIGDFSYGLYIYAFPIQQLIVYYLREKINIFQYIGLSMLITAVVSVITTLIVDNNVKRIKEKIFKR